MNEEALALKNPAGAKHTGYQAAGWLVIIAAALFPLAFIIKIVEKAIGIRGFSHIDPQIGASDFIIIAVTAFLVYALIMFRKLLNERYNYHGIDVLITLSILCNILFITGSLVLRGLYAVMWRWPEVELAVAYFAFMAISMVIFGIVDIFIGIRLLKIQGNPNVLLKIFAVVSLIAGLCELTVLLTPIALFLAPVSFVVLGLVLLKEDEGLEFV